MTYSHAKVEGQWSVGSKDRVETNGREDRRMEAIALPPSLMRSVTSMNADHFAHADHMYLAALPHTTFCTDNVAAAKPPITLNYSITYYGLSYK